MPNGNGEISPWIPIAALGGIGALVLLSNKGGGVTTGGVCVPSILLQRMDVTVNASGQLVATPTGIQKGRNPNLWHPTALFRLASVSSGQQQTFFSLSVPDQEAMMRMSPDDVISFWIYIICSGGMCG